MTQNKPSEDEKRFCSFCENEVELKELNGHWLVLFCSHCDRTFERAASKDLDGISVGDLKNLNDFSE
jgi:ribosomal protein L37AE/L43A